MCLVMYRVKKNVIKNKTSLVFIGFHIETNTSL